MTNFLDKYRKNENFSYIKYWRGRYNLGDLFSEFLFEKIYDKSLLDKIPNRKTMMFIGSEIPAWANDSSLVCGLGWRLQKLKLKTPNVNPNNFLYTRGKISRQRVIDSGIDIPHDIPIGDTGLLASLLYTPTSQKTHDIGIITHWSASGNLDSYLMTARKIFPEKDIVAMHMGDKGKSPQDLFEFIQSCKVVVASSLHAIIFSHSFGVPALFFSNVDGYKFQDYYSVYDRIDYPDLSVNTSLEKALEHVSDGNFIQSVNPTHDEVHEIQKNILQAMPYRWCFTELGKKLMNDFGLSSDEKDERPYVADIVQSSEMQKTCFFMQNKNAETLSKSSSGGVIPEIVELVRSRGGSCFGVVFSEDFMSLKYVEIDDGNMTAAMGSKYMNASLSGENKKRIVDLLEQGKQVLFIGRPCQCHWMRNRFKHYKNLILVELFCFGVPNDGLWRNYATRLIQEHGQMKSVDFRDKSDGWRNYNFKVEFANGDVLKEPHNKNQYMRSYLSIQNLMPKCHPCRFKEIQSKADISCGDAWGTTTENDKGTSIALCHTKQGLDIIHQIEGKFVSYRPSDTELHGMRKSNRGCPILSNPNVKNPKSPEQLKLKFLNEPNSEEKFDIIVSFGTYKARLDKGYTLEFLERLVKQKFNGKYHIVANLWEHDYESCSDEIKAYFKEHDIEVILTNIDYRTHNKYYFVFQKYPGIPIVTFDDDQLYRYDALQLMYDTYKRHPNTLIGGFCVIPGGIVDQKTGRRGKPRPPTGTPPSRGIQIWGSGGNFYPPEFTEKITMEMIDNWISTMPEKNKYDNDQFLFRMAKKLGFNGMVVECTHKKPTWRGYLVEKFLPTADDETAKTWTKA